ncbi:hypothetical protein CH370_13950 [Leptospira kmetyi]|uniref:Uncharacterized protein n=1 Tax=Leptospira kmetyi TaxID=408139 RepID=A0ABX4N5Q3_9LEPT|nr:hypothetical protein CH378_18640 [Leptospira kmetyi]PJZ40854.1 hypothetical protein CH370_13950 [Leptospira kmetyi]
MIIFVKTVIGTFEVSKIFRGPTRWIFEFYSNVGFKTKWKKFYELGSTLFRRTVNVGVSRKQKKRAPWRTRSKKVPLPKNGFG